MNKVDELIKKLKISPSKVQLQYWKDINKEITEWLKTNPSQNDINKLMIKGQVEKLTMLLDDSDKENVY